MDESKTRMTDPAGKPEAKALARWLGSEAYQSWTRLTRFINAAYPGVFEPEWLFGGSKYGWGLRYKKSRSFCTMIPERKRLMVQIVFGGAERERAEKMLGSLSPGVRVAYRKAKTFHDGKWLFLAAQGDVVLGDIEKLLAVKRPPKAARA